MTTLSVFELDPKESKGAPEGLLRIIQEHRGTNLEIDVKQVSTLSARQIELILRADAHWQKDDLSFCLTGASAEFVLNMTNVGVPSRLFCEGN